MCIRRLTCARRFPKLIRNRICSRGLAMLARLIMTLTLATAFHAGSLCAQVANPLSEKQHAANPVQPQFQDSVSAPTPRTSPVPEPGTVLMMAGPVAVGWVIYWRRRWKAGSNATSPNAPTIDP